MTNDTSHRDPVTGQYDFDGDYDRLCKCGHSLGVHSSGGYYCDTDAIGNKEPEAAGCKCERFRPSGKRRASLGTVGDVGRQPGRGADVDK